MALRCANCKKGIMIGEQHTHHAGVAGGRWKRRAPRTAKLFKPNLHLAKIMVNGTVKRVKLCTKCLRLAKSTNVNPQSKLKTPVESAPVVVA